MESIADYIHLYINAPYKTWEGTGKLVGLDMAHNTCEIQFDDWHTTTYSLKPEDLKVTPVRPILRIQFTIDEIKHILLLSGEYDEEDFVGQEEETARGYGLWAMVAGIKHTMQKHIPEPLIFRLMGNSKIWKYLLSINIDMFGLITTHKIADPSQTDIDWMSKPLLGI